MRSDDELLKGIAAKSTEAFEEFFARYRVRVYRHLISRLHCPDSVEDLIQEVFLRVWIRAEQWDGRGSCAGWLMRIATNLSLNQIRTMNRHREIPLEVDYQAEDEDDSHSVPSWLADTDSDPCLLCLQAEKEESFKHLIEILPEDKREVSRLVYESQMDLNEAAECLGIPVGTVKSRLYYARKHLAQKLNELEIGEEE